jgi:hypothetical protein
MSFVPSRKASSILGVHPNTLRNWESRVDTTIKTPSGQRLYNTDSYIGTFKKLNYKIVLTLFIHVFRVEIKKTIFNHKLTF